MKILVAVDGSDAAFNTLRNACNIANIISAYVIAFYVNKGEEYTPEETSWLSIKDRISGELETAGNEVLQKAYEIGKDLNIHLERIISYGVPWEEIIKYSQRYGIIKLIAMGHSSKGKGTQEFVESATKNVVSKSEVPVFVMSNIVNIRNILIAIDDSETSKRVTLFGGNLAKFLSADIGVISVTMDAEVAIREYGRISDAKIESHIKDFEREYIKKAENAITIAKNILEPLDIHPHIIRKTGDPAEEIISTAKNYDLTVIGVKDSLKTKPIGKVSQALLDNRLINLCFVQ